MNCPSVRRQAGFTLIELVISSAIAVIILTAAYVCLRAGIASRKMVEARSDALQGARVALALMSADLRCATPLSSDCEFLGRRRQLGEQEADNLDFATHNYTPKREHEGDFCEVSYFVDRDRDTGALSLWRRRDPTPDPEPLSGGSREEIVRGVKSLEIAYYDGFEWFDEWGDPSGRSAQENSSDIESNMQGLPEAVRIRLAVNVGKTDSVTSKRSSKKDDTDQGEPPMTLETVVRLNLAGLANSSIGGDTASGQSGVSNPQPNN